MQVAQAADVEDRVQGGAQHVDMVLLAMAGLRQERPGNHAV